MQDYAQEIRKKLINDPKLREQEYRKMISEGYSEHVAANLSGHHPALDHFDKTFTKVTWAIIVICILMLLFMFAETSNAMMDEREGNRNGQQTERALVTCLNGGEMVLSDGSRWQCIKVGMEK